MKKDSLNTDSDSLRKKPGLFGQTDWGVLAGLKGGSRSEQQPFLDVLAKKYWTPIFQYLLVQGYGQFEAQDLAQDFFVFALKTQLFSKADPKRGRCGGRFPLDPHQSSGGSPGAIERPAAAGSAAA